MSHYIRKRENGRYQAIVSYKNQFGEWKQVSKGGFVKRGEAKEWAVDKDREMESVSKLNSIGKGMSLDFLCGLYVDECERLEQIGGRTVNTVRMYKALREFVKEIGDIEVVKLTSYDIERFFQNKSAETGKSYKVYKSKLKTVLNYACDKLEIIAKVPKFDFYLPDASDKRIKFIDFKMYQNILKAVKSDYDRLFIEVAYNTGMRAGEIMGITDNCVFRTHIEVNKQWSRAERALVRLKTDNSYRDVPIDLDLYNKLRSAPVDLSGRIFYKNSFSSIDSLLFKFNTSLHCFRHTFATRLVSEHIDPTIISAVVGDDIATILKTYTEINKNKIDEGYEKIRNLKAF